MCRQPVAAASNCPLTSFDGGLLWVGYAGVGYAGVGYAGFAGARSVMGYHVTILRTRGGEPDPITRAELDHLLSARPDLREAEEDGFRIIAGKRTDGSDVSVAWTDGELWAKNPDDETVQWMLELASALGARVRGDELETYRTVDESYLHPDDRELLRASEEESRAMRRRNRRWQLMPKVAVLAAVVAALLVRFLRG
jgi:hypothetical protein